MHTSFSQSNENNIISSTSIITFGLSEEQNIFVKTVLPAREDKLIIIEVATDFIAFSASACIIHAAALSPDDCEMIFDYYSEINGCSDETVFWIGKPLPPSHLLKTFKCFETFEELSSNLKYHLLIAYKKSKKARDFSKQLMDCLRILKLIQLYPGIRTQELADRIELSVRTIQRYIATLQAAGEWIQYDYAKKGWYLQHGISIFLNDC